MALLTAGTKLTTSLTALVWNPAGLNTTDLATLNESIKNPNAAAGKAVIDSCRIEGGMLFLPGKYRTSGSGIPIQPGDYICVDGAGWPIIVPAAIFGTSWQHS